VSKPALLLILLDFGVIAVLPRIFFRKDGRFHAMWWLTALPFCACPAFLLVALATDLGPLVPDNWTETLQTISVPFGAASIALIFMTLGTHRIPLALWHQDNDAPQHIVTYGAYSRIRHPFYTSFLLAFLGTFAYFPHWVTLFALGYGFVILNVTAAREEQRLSTSEFGAEYQQYVTHTGRFFPRVGSRSVATL
jgi:protein-S-isoprenylcysteine O-methyltransferase Ste14